MNQKRINSVIAEGIVLALEGEGPCPVVKSNVINKTPPYPYLSFTITSQTLPQRGTDGRLEIGIYSILTEQVWSFTIQSDDENEAVRLARKTWQWFRRAGLLYLSDNEIAVRSVGAIGNRDVFLGSRYEYRQGFDVTFALTDILRFDEPIIETAKLERRD